jgi:adenylosuccinate synthase
MSIVIGLGYGDEGKGLTTSFLCSRTKDPLVVRFNGGHQAGHTVVWNNKRHMFSNFGAGTLQGAETYWSKFCTIHPVGFMNEYKILKEMGLTPRIGGHPFCPITTPYDVKFNHQMEENFRNGSVGVGFGATIGREQAHYTLHLHDLQKPAIMKAKLDGIRKYYIGVEVSEEELAIWMSAVAQMIQIIDVIFNPNHIIRHQDRVIFEGAQGILLDMDHGFFPNVTRSNTTSKNALILNPDADDIYYVTRCYQTRHGAGFMSNEVDNLGLQNNENESNIYSPWQGKLRVGELDVNLINYALDIDSQYHTKTKSINLVITCLDQLPDFDVDEFLDDCEYGFEEVWLSRGPSVNFMEKYHG